MPLQRVLFWRAVHVYHIRIWLSCLLHYLGSWGGGKNVGITAPYGQGANACRANQVEHSPRKKKERVTRPGQKQTLHLFGRQKVKEKRQAVM